MIKKITESFDNNKRIDLLQQAADKINEGIELIRDALNGSGMERNAEAYIIGHLNNWANGGNPYDNTIPVIIEKLEKGEDE